MGTATATASSNTAAKRRRGLLHQGWKDSDDAVFHADGTLARGPIALCEVQAYVYAAWRAGASLASLLGKGEMAVRLGQKADELQARFERAFWCEELSTYALALDGDKRRCRVRTSNAGQCLFTAVMRLRAGPTCGPRVIGAGFVLGVGRADGGRFGSSL